jgi:hypothetical protein
LHVEYVANGETFFFLFWICEGSKNWKSGGRVAIFRPLSCKSPNHHSITS